MWALSWPRGFWFLAFLLCPPFHWGAGNEGENSCLFKNTDSNQNLPLGDFSSLKPGWFRSKFCTESNFSLPNGCKVTAVLLSQVCPAVQVTSYDPHSLHFPYSYSLFLNPYSLIYCAQGSNSAPVLTRHNFNYEFSHIIKTTLHKFCPLSFAKWAFFFCCFRIID